jgi:pimeloyl-ACP methyl ester carboxylesterase
LLLSLPLGWAVGRRRAVAWQPDGRLWIDGGWFLLGFALSIFAVRYALGVTFGVWPRLAAQPAWIAGAGAVGGAIAGTGLGWLAGSAGTTAPLARLDVACGRRVAARSALGLAAMIAFSAPGPIPRLAAGDSMPGIESWDFAQIPPVQRVAARDGAPLTYRLYPGRADRTVVLVHGSSGTGLSMHKAAQALQAAGATVYAISLRGHGGSGTVNGDTSYLRQLDDDLVDFVKAVGLADAKTHRTLAGFSSGGGFVLRVASGRHAGDFDAYLAVSPHVGQGAPTGKPNAGGWVNVAMPRVIGLSLLDGFGLPWFQDLPVIRFATDAAREQTAARRSIPIRLLAGMQVPRDWRAALARIDAAAAVVVGRARRAVQCRRVPALVRDAQSEDRGVAAAGLGHMDMIADPRGTAAVGGGVATAGGRHAAARSVERFDKKVREDHVCRLRW